MHAPVKKGLMLGALASATAMAGYAGFTGESQACDQADGDPIDGCPWTQNCECIGGSYNGLCSCYTYGAFSWTCFTSYYVCDAYGSCGWGGSC